MKKLLLIMLASLFMLTSCDLFNEAEEDADYVGTWISTYTSGTATYIFGSTTFSRYYEYNDDTTGTNYYYKGNISIDLDQLTEIYTEESNDGVTYFDVSGTYSNDTYTYNVSSTGETLTLTDSDGTRTLTKQ